MKLASGDASDAFIRRRPMKARTREPVGARACPHLHQPVWRLNRQPKEGDGHRRPRRRWRCQRAPAGLGRRQGQRWPADRWLRRQRGLLSCTVALGRLRLRDDALLDVAEARAGVLGRVRLMLMRIACIAAVPMSSTLRRHQVTARVVFVGSFGCHRRSQDAGVGPTCGDRKQPDEQHRRSDVPFPAEAERMTHGVQPTQPMNSLW